MKMILGAPSAIRSAADRLAAAGEQLTDSGAQVGRARDSVAGAWSGPAAVAFTGTADRTQQVCRQSGLRLSDVAAEGRRYADCLQRAQDELGHLGRREAQLGEEELALRVKAAAVAPASALGLDPAVSARSSLEMQLSDLQAARSRVAEAARDVARRHDLDKAAFAAALTAPPPVTSFGDVVGVCDQDRTLLKELNEKRREVGTLVRNIGHVVAAFRAKVAVEQIQRLPMPLTAGDAARLAGAEGRLAAAGTAFTSTSLPKVVPGAIADKLPAAKAVGGRINLAMTAWEGMTDAARGDPDHPGLRDVATRVAGAGGAVGAGILLASATNPIGMALVTGYGAYKLGTWVYDHREDIKRVASAAWRRVAPVVQAGRQALAKTAYEAASSVADAAGTLRDRAAGVATRFSTVVKGPRFGW